MQMCLIKRMGKNVNIYFSGSNPWNNVVGDMARRLVAYINENEDNFEAFIGTKESEGDIIHYFDIYPSVNASRAGIMGMHALSSRIQGRRLEDIKSFLKMHKAVIVLTDKMAEDVMPYNKDVFVIPGGVDKNFLPSKDTSKQIQGVIGACGLNRKGNMDVKGDETLSDIMRKLPHFKYLITGLGWNKSVDTAKELNIDCKVEIFENKDMPEKFYHKIDVLLCTSREEGGYLPMLEALACGVPVAATKVGYAYHLKECPYLETYDFTGNDLIGDSIDATKAISRLFSKMYDGIVKYKGIHETRNKISKHVSSFTWGRYCENHLRVYEWLQ